MKNLHLGYKKSMSPLLYSSFFTFSTTGGVYLSIFFTSFPSTMHVTSLKKSGWYFSSELITDQSLQYSARSCCPHSSPPSLPLRSAAFHNKSCKPSRFAYSASSSRSASPHTFLASPTATYSAATLGRSTISMYPYPRLHPVF